MSAIPEPVAPQYAALKNLHRQTALVRNDLPVAAIVAPRDEYSHAAARTLQAALHAKTGILLPIIDADDARAAVPLRQNLILLGNRSTNKTLGKLYDFFFALTDLKYPGAGGHEIRSVHNPFGNGCNAIILGGSDEAGVQAAVQRFIQIFAEVETGQNAFFVDWLLEVKLAQDVQLPTEGAGRMPTWQDSSGYTSEGYFGWNSLSKNLALYAMTGEARFAQEFLRLSCPDATAKKEIEAVDGERIENKDDPLAGPYHYNATRLILYWDLVEASPLFSDAQRLRITNALARQLDHFCSGPNSSWTGKKIYQRIAPAKAIGSRHEIQTALSLFALARYFARDYGDDVWKHTLQAAGDFYFAPLVQPQPWLGGENETDSLFWYCTDLAPVLDYMILSDDHRGLQSGALNALLKNQEILWDGTARDNNLRYAALDYLNKAAHLTGDGRWLTYAQRLPLNADEFRLDQSFWPDELKATAPDDLLNRWTIWFLPSAQIAARGTGFDSSQSFANMSYRSAPDNSGDFLLLDGMNGQARNPYHTFALLHLRINGATLLKGYLNQVRTTVNGVAQPKVALDAALQKHFALGQSVLACAEVPDLPFCNWRRTVYLRAGKYTLAIDQLKFRADCRNFEAEFWWQNEGEIWATQNGDLVAAGVLVISADSLPAKTEGDAAKQLWSGDAEQDEEKTFFSLIAPDAKEKSLKGARIAPNAAVFAAPETVLVATENYRHVQAKFSVRAENYFAAANLQSAPGLQTSAPIDVDWDYQTGILNLLAAEEITLTLALSQASAIKLNGQKLQSEGAEISLTLDAGEHIFTGTFPSSALQSTLCGAAELLAKTPKTVAQKPIHDVPENLPELSPGFQIELPETIRQIIAVSEDSEPRYYVAAGNTVYELDDAGKIIRQFAASDEVTKLHWWSQPGVLLLGTRDQKILAYSPDGELRWSFQSQMAPEVYAAGKTYWFNTARGHEGIHGLDSGVFLDNCSQLFVGSACTMEIVDERGQLMHRLPQFWGPTELFQLIPAGDGSINLLTARDINDNDTPHVINNRTLDPEPRGFYEVPASYTYIGGWTDQRRLHFFHVDVDGDGRKEIISDCTGVWNRISTWNESGAPKSTIYFGPGPTCYEAMNAIVPALIRGTDVADIDGDGRAEIVTVLSSGWIIALDGQCRIKWSRHADDIPTALKIVKDEIIVSQENGTLLTLDGTGRFLSQTKVSGTVNKLHAALDGGVIAVGEKTLRHFKPRHQAVS